MAKTIKEKIAALFPEIKQALETTGEEVSIEGVKVSRAEAEKINSEFKKQMESSTDECVIDWDVIPLKLCVASRNWSSLQESLNQI